MRRILGSLALAALLLLPAARASAQITEPALLDSIQRTGFQYFWDEANPANGLIKDRSTAGSPASIAATGFGLSAICVGVDHGWVGRPAAATRVLTTLQTFWNGPQGTASIGMTGYKGWFYHFLDMNTATRTWSSELSSIDTALLLGGILHCRQYFDGEAADEVQIRMLADSIYRRVDFKWMQNLGTGIRMGWNPESGFGSFGTWQGYNEAMILYILAIGSPVPERQTAASAWNTWTYLYNWNIQYGYTYIIFPPLFGHQYSHCWIDFRNIQDNFCRNHSLTYFENSRRATYAQRAYSIDDPMNWGYSDSLWGITASDIQGGYLARGAPPAQDDNGTIAPTAPGGSIPFAPEICIPALRNMYNAYPQVWGKYGFKDAFKPFNGWVGTDWLGIDQGPFVLMIENYLNGSVWYRFMQNPYVQSGLTRIGFTTVLDAGDPRLAGDLRIFPGEPNPFTRSTTVRYRLGRTGAVRVTVHDVQGREVLKLVDGVQPAGDHAIAFDGGGLAAGVYLVRLEQDRTVRMRTVVRLR